MKRPYVNLTSKNIVHELKNVLNENIGKLCNEADFQEELDFVQKSVYETIIHLIEKNEYTIEEWQKISSLSALNFEPLHSLFKRIGDKVIFDRDALIQLKSDDMYIWMSDIANCVRRNLNSSDFIPI